MLRFVAGAARQTRRLEAERVGPRDAAVRDTGRDGGGPEQGGTDA